MRCPWRFIGRRLSAMANSSDARFWRVFIHSSDPRFSIWLFNVGLLGDMKLEGTEWVPRTVLIGIKNLMILILTIILGTAIPLKLILKVCRSLFLVLILSMFAHIEDFMEQLSLWWLEIWLQSFFERLVRMIFGMRAMNRWPVMSNIMFHLTQSMHYLNITVSSHWLAYPRLFDLKITTWKLKTILNIAIKEIKVEKFIFDEMTRMSGLYI